MDGERRVIAFDGNRRVAEGAPREVARAVHRATEAGRAASILVFDSETSRPVEFDLRGSQDDVLARLDAAADTSAAPARGRGRPRLGVTAREVTLLPRHWDWLAGEPGGASAALRRLVEQAMRSGQGPARARQAAEAVDRFMSAMTGNLPGHEEASRAFWRGERDAFHALTDTWPADVRDHLRALAGRAWTGRDG